MSFQDAATPDDPGSEDCLYLNIYVPASAKSDPNCPSCSGFTAAATQAAAAPSRATTATFLPLKGVILVTINYRLGVFGFMALPELATEQGGSSGNYGMMDMVAALQWVKQNIGKFGGDPGNVTIFGESAGSLP
jgi:para-nitrobenzyl esterase